ncbi:MAG: dual specificity protein phosphatase family protein [Planctomycetes bacterium]|nr:dual specificity protein phosphatase family protein [Planctomycetota bacterium]
MRTKTFLAEETPANETPAKKGLWKRALVGAAALLLALVILIGGRIVWWIHVEHRWVTIRDAELYRSAAMPVDELRASIREHGIRTVIDLRDVDLDLVEAERSAMAQDGVRYVHIPSPLLPTDAIVDRFVDEVHGDGLPRPILVHCKHGVGRSAVLSAVYEIEEHGATVAEALARTSRLPDSLHFLSDWIPAFGQLRNAKGDYVRSYAPRHGR